MEIRVIASVFRQHVAERQYRPDMFGPGKSDVGSRLDLVVKPERRSASRVVALESFRLGIAGIEDGQDMGHTADAVRLELIQRTDGQQGDRCLAHGASY